MGSQDADAQRWDLCLYVVGTTPEGRRARANLEELCEAYLAGRYSIEVVDLLQQPDLAATDQIFAAPTVVRRAPPPVRKVIGDLSDEAQALAGLDIDPR